MCAPCPFPLLSGNHIVILSSEISSFGIPHWKVEKQRGIMLPTLYKKMVYSWSLIGSKQNGSFDINVDFHLSPPIWGMV